MSKKEKAILRKKLLEEEMKNNLLRRKIQKKNFLTKEKLKEGQKK
tara:strand:- start:2282 stop:2416 length:135 start_codon:yes stop_codon:yes gene_type:complete